MTQEQLAYLRVYLADYKAWIDGGAPEEKPYTRTTGLCWNVWVFDNEMAKKAPRPGYSRRAGKVLKKLLERDFPNAMATHEAPFNQGGWDSYFAESEKETCHTNAARLAWLNKMLAELPDWPVYKWEAS